MGGCYLKRKSKNKQILLGAVIALSVVLILLLAAVFWMNRNDPGHNGGAGTEQTTQSPDRTTEEPKETDLPSEETTPPTEPTMEPEPTEPPTMEPEPTEPPTTEPEPTEPPTTEPEPTEPPTTESEPTEPPTTEPEPTEPPTTEPEPTEPPTTEPEPTEPPTTEPEPTEPPTTEPEPPIKVPEETESVYEDVQVQTAYCDLFYSGQWADSMRTERITEDFAETILFYGTAEGTETALFAVYFASATDNSFPVGVYSTADGLTVDISAEIFELENKGWTDAGFGQICAMQEQVNYVIAKLKETTQTEPPVQVPEETEPVYEDVQVQTAYCKLFYSGQWADSMRTERITEDFAETILFYGTAEGTETALFAVHFADATDSSFPVGAYSTADGLTVDISVEIFEMEVGGWTDTGFELICTMQEQVNYVLEKLEETEGFIPVQ